MYELRLLHVERFLKRWVPMGAKRLFRSTLKERSPLGEHVPHAAHDARWGESAHLRPGREHKWRSQLLK